MTATEQILGQFIEQEAAKNWGAHKKPYLLSSLAPDFKAAGHDYKLLIGNESLKSATRRLSDDYQFILVEHPTQKAKIGVIPKGEIFEFAVEVASSSKTRTNSASSAEDTDKHQRAVLEFFNALGKLPPHLLDGIVIPTNVLVRLLASR